MAPMEGPRALTLHQPWASLVALLVKRIETRSWSTKYRGRLYIHAGARQVHSGHFLMLARTAVVAGLITREQEQMFRALAVPFAAIVATCELVDVVPTDELRVRSEADERRDPATQWQQYPWPDRLTTFVHSGQLHYGNFAPGRYAWLLDDIQPVDPPVPCRGRQGLWTPPEDVLAAVA